MYCRYNYFYDRKRKEILVKAGAMVYERRAEPRRYEGLGSFFAHENQPYILGNQVVRDCRNDHILLLNI